ncbi:hypothetical protein M378DRAFT_92506 [Amanita muscaria Koide BX008]|uniref:HAT C-terminal dimerisation domain-containing protein n=1 Tax=Amanita muscaria (strain Koide BX008) TaxID=946122 RepID=A0A0C2SKJ9_AMAMK|nr:hypothetical protein M378DRAFT_92506 [Amanita muscaria Koide BX008]
MANHPKSLDVEQSIHKGIENLDKWYNKVNDTDAYFICLVLDPNVKNAYALDKWDAESYAAGMVKLEKVVSVNPDGCRTTDDKPRLYGQYGYSWMRASVRSRQEAEHVSSSSGPRDELKRYLDGPLEEVDNVVAWWGHHSFQYPTLSSMARDYLAIQGSATPSERAFSSGGTTGTAKRNRLNVEAFEALQLLKSAYRNGHVGADSEAERHAISLSDIFTTNSDVTMPGYGCSMEGKGLGE